MINDTIADTCDGGDSIRFLWDNTTELSYEIEKWVDGSNRLVWVNFTTLYSGSDTKNVTMYYNNSGASDGQDVAGTWNGNYVMVQHMNDDSTSTIVDSTVYGNNGTKDSANEPNEVSAKIGQGQDFDGTDDDIEIVDDDSLEPVNTLTVSAWINFDDTTHAGIVFAKGTYSSLGAGKNGYILSKVSSANPNLRVIFYTGVDTAHVHYYNTFITPSVWYHVVFTYNNSDLVFFVNGSYDDNVSITGDIDYTGDQECFIGFADHLSYKPYAVFDEMRVSNVARNTSWISTSYHSSNRTTGFLTFGAEQDKPAGATAPDVTTNDATGVEETNATICGTLTDNGSVDTTCWFVYGNQTPPTDNNDSQDVIADGASFNYNWQSLTPGTIHYYHTLANNSAGWDNDSGNIKSFLTKPNASTGASCSAGEGYINVSWSTATGADKYLVRYKAGSSPTSVTDGTLFDNVTLLYINKSIGAGTHYFSIWSYAYEASPALHQYSDSYDTTSGTETLATWHSSPFGGSVEVLSSEEPQFSNPSSYTNTTDNSISISEWNITISDDGGQFNWTIDTSPDIGNSSANDDSNGSKTVTLSGLAYNTNYTIYVNATDGEGAGRGGWHRVTYWFETTTAPSWHSSTFGGSVTVGAGSVDVRTDPTTWTGGTVNCGDNIRNNFTFYQDGSATIQVKIGFNATNYTFVNYTTWSNDGSDQYCANFTIDEWSSESMIEPKAGEDPVTILKDSLSGSSSFLFGVRIWMPKGLTSSAVLEDFEIMLEATDIS